MSGRRLGWLVVGLGLLLALVVAVATRPDTGPFVRLDPDNAGPDGARAVARVLADEGVDVQVVRSADDFDAVSLAGASVVVTSTAALGESTTARLLARSEGAPIVLVEPGTAVVDLVTPGAEVRAVPPGEPIPAQCAASLFNLLRIEVDNALAYPDRPGSCFPAEGGAVLGRVDGMVLFGAGDALTNDQVTRADNAAVALRLLGQHDRLVWYVANAADLRAGDEVGLLSLLPDWVLPGLGIGLLTLIALVLWRGRRLGPLVVEPLPVVVKAIETTQSRGRLYRKAGDRAHAAAALRAASRARASERLALDRDVDLATLADRMSRHTGRAADDLRGLIDPHAPPPRSDRDLVSLAGALAELDDSLRKVSP